MGPSLIFILILLRGVTCTDEGDGVMIGDDDVMIDKQYFLHRLLEVYGDGSSLTVQQLQKLIDHSAIQEKSKHVNDLEETKVEGHGWNSSCGQDNAWIQDTDCLNKMCFTAEDVLDFHGVSIGRVNASLLMDISPTLLYAAQNTECQEPPRVHIKPKIAEVWGYSFLCVTIINLCSLMGMIFLPLMHKVFYKKLLMFMVALAVGTLSGSSLLFLIPECFDMGSEDNPFFKDYVWKCTTILSGIYLFFLIERLLKNIMDWRKKLKKFDSSDSSMEKISDSEYYESLEKRDEDGSHFENAPLSSVKTRSVRRNESINMSFKIPNSPQSQIARSTDSNKSLTTNTTTISEKTLQSNDSEAGFMTKTSVVKFDLGPDEAECKTLNVSAGSRSASKPQNSDTPEQASHNVEAHVNYGMTRSPDSTTSFNFMRVNNSSSQLLQKDTVLPSTPTESDTSQELIKTVAWMVIFGDGIHNFIDGLSIGAAFSKNILAGVSVSVAVVCEELPHELGDFAILLNSGMSMRKALLYNFLSACMCYLGLAIGIVVGEMTSGSSWIFALAAGMFLYISLVDMLPEVNHESEEEIKLTGHTWRIFFLQNAGLLTGYGLMLVLALFSDRINFQTGF